MNAKQRNELRKQAQREKAIFQIGAGELHDGNIEAIREAFNTREIIKIKVNRQDQYDKKITREIADTLESKIKGSHIIGVIGTTIIIYKKLEKKKGE